MELGRGSLLPRNPPKNGKSIYSSSLLLFLRGKTFPSSVPSHPPEGRELGESFATKDAREQLYKDLP